MADESKVAGVAAAVKNAKKAKPKKKPVRRKAAARPSTATKPRKKKGAAKAPTSIRKAAPVSGQSGPPIELSVEGLNAKEGKIFAALNGEGAGVRPIFSITELSEACFKSQAKKRSNSWTRNSLRRLIQSGLVEKVERGKYRVSDTGRKKLARAA